MVREGKKGKKGKKGNERGKEGRHPSNATPPCLLLCAHGSAWVEEDGDFKILNHEVSSETEQENH